MHITNTSCKNVWYNFRRQDEFTIPNKIPDPRTNENSSVSTGTLYINIVKATKVHFHSAVYLNLNVNYHYCIVM